MFWQGLKAHPTAAEAPPGPGGGKQLWDCTARTAAADLAPQVAHSLAETVPGKVGSCLGMGCAFGVTGAALPVPAACLSALLILSASPREV